MSCGKCCKDQMSYPSCPAPHQAPRCGMGNGGMLVGDSLNGGFGGGFGPGNQGGQTYNQTYDINGGTFNEENSNYYNNYYRRYNYYNINDTNYISDYVTDYNIYRYNQQNVYTGLQYLDSVNVVDYNGSGHGCGFPQPPRCPQSPVYPPQPCCCKYR